MIRTIEVALTAQAKVVLLDQAFVDEFDVGLVLKALVQDPLVVIWPPFLHLDMLDMVSVDLNDCVNVDEVGLVQLDFELLVHV